MRVYPQYIEKINILNNHSIDLVGGISGVLSTITTDLLVNPIKVLKINKQVGKKSMAIQSLIEEYLATANIKSACEKIKFVDKSVEDNFLEKFNIYCLIYEDRGVEAQLMLDLLKERRGHLYPILQ